YKVGPASSIAPECWEAGTQVHELIAGIGAEVDYLAELGKRCDPTGTTRRKALAAAYRTTVPYERTLLERLLNGLESLPGVKIYGITDRASFGERCATVSFRIGDHNPTGIAEFLRARSTFTWESNFDALNLSAHLR